MTRFSRRSFLAAAAATPLLGAAKGKRPLVGLELFSVRDQLAKDLDGTVTAVAKMGYQGVEFFSPYFAWTPERAKEVRKLLDGLGIKATSTHNDRHAFAPNNIDKAIELNKTIGSNLIVMASAGNVKDLDGWKKVAEELTTATEKLQAAGMRAGYHNHQAEFKELEGKRPIEVIAANTPKSVVLQLDVGTCVEVGQDPVAWIKANPGRIASIHCKEWSKDKGYKVLFGDGAAPWKDIFKAAEKAGGVETYLIEQEGADMPPLETVEQCLANFKKIHG